MVLSWSGTGQAHLRTLSRVHVGIISTKRFKEECHLRGQILAQEKSRLQGSRRAPPGSSPSTGDLAIHEPVKSHTYWANG